VDLDLANMTNDQREVFQCLEEEEKADANSEDDDAGYEELEDDFLMIANEGKPALVEASDSVAKSLAKSDEFGNKDVVIVKDEEADALKARLAAIREKFFSNGQLKKDEDDMMEEMEDMDDEE
jgi:cupin superfamily acireductone dioxygenase involved in methionine salvage